MQRSYQSLRVQKKNGLAGFTRVTEMKSFERGVPIGIQGIKYYPLNEILYGI